PRLAGLLRPEAYPHPVDSIEIHETHGAWVILAGTYAYKLKKPVDLGFFDFSTFEKRAADAEAELRLNRRLAPATYLDVVDVVEQDGAARIGGEGPVLERAVLMRRLPAEQMLPALLARDAVSSHLIRRLARLIARFHAEAPTGPGVNEHGARPTIEANWAENFAQIAPYANVTIPTWELELIQRWVQHRLAVDAELFDRRVAEGCVRDGHGDLHAASVCIAGGELIVFDCIEFSARYRCADVAAEVAFMAMDLDHSARPDLSWTFVEEYVQVTGDQELRTLLDFYKCYRAFVRGKVLSFRLRESGLPPAERDAITAEARAYFDLATIYAGGFPHPLLLVTSGLPASGKTTLATALAQRLGLRHISTDVVRKRAAGLHPTERAGTDVGQGIYGPEVTVATYHTLRRQAELWLRRGVSVVLDGTFNTADQRHRVRILANDLGARFLLIRTECDETTTRERLARRERDASRVSDASWEVYKQMHTTFEPVIFDKLPPEEIVEDPTGGAGIETVLNRLANRPGDA
ncbi:MAG: uncharacterized protein QOF51_2855, partial [Chloroflexota bacterium]|nr:uncharacterized protein [Chloroflexota bacterium]